jgi:hypothetical protein
MKMVMVITIIIEEIEKILNDENEIIINNKTFKF